jgi:hypothetical protein
MIRLSQSKTKSWESTTCKRKWQAEVSGEVVVEPTPPMVNGSFFETICLGSGAKGQVINDLPRLKSGAKSADQLRIEAQAQRFLRMVDPEDPLFLGWNIVDRQVYIESPEYDGTIDFVVERDGELAVVDLKLTADLGNPNGWWGDIGSMDHIQLAFYKYLYKRKYGVDVETYYWIFDYSTQERCKIVKINISEESMRDYLERFLQVSETLLELNDLLELPRTPNYHECNRCRLSCNVRAITPDVKFEEYDC